MADITNFYSAKVFPFPPNWASDVSEKITFPSDVMSSHNETEQRISLVATPVRSLAFRSHFLTALEAAKFAALVYGWQHKVFGVPWWPMAAELLSAAEIGATVLNVNTGRMHLGDLIYLHVFVLLWRDSENWEYAELADVDTFDPTSITMYDSLVREWPAGTLVVPFAWCRMASFEQPTDLITDVYAAADVEFESASGGIFGWDYADALAQGSLS